MHTKNALCVKHLNCQIDVSEDSDIWLNYEHTYCQTSELVYINLKYAYGLSEHILTHTLFILQSNNEFKLKDSYING